MERLGRELEAARANVEGIKGRILDAYDRVMEDDVLRFDPRLSEAAIARSLGISRTTLRQWVGKHTPARRPGGVA